MKRFNILKVLPTIALSLLLVTGCFGGDDAAGYWSSAPPGGGEFGATQGGVQDMSLARSLVDQGKVPPPEAFVVEAMFSEHDLPVEGPPCSTLLCLRAVMGIAPDQDNALSAWVQVGMSSTINPDTFVRPSITIVATVDVSGSMGWDYPNQTTAGALASRLAHAIVDQLDENDRFALVTFGSTARTVLNLTPGSEKTTIHAAIDRLEEDGSTNMEAGIARAIPIAKQAVGTTDEVRIMILSDYNPNVGSVHPSEFQSLALEAADDGIGMTLFGLGLGLAPSVMKAMSEIRGGNAFSAVDAEQVDALMEDSWPWMVCPIAYDLVLSVKPAGPLTVSNTYGFPGEPAADEVTMEVASVFLSRRKGALLVQFDRSQTRNVTRGAQSDLHLSYVTPDGEAFEQTLEADYQGQPLNEQGQYMPQVGIAKTVALALLVSGMREAAETYKTGRDEAAVIMEGVLERFASDAGWIEDPALDAEVAFAQALLDLMRAGAPQGNFYYGY
jgi:Ca-activated chloride channel family protein